MNCQLTKTKPFFLKKSSCLTLNRSGKLEQKRRAAHRRRRTEAAQRCQSFKKAKVAGAKKASGSAAGEEEQKQQQRSARRQICALVCAVAFRSLVSTGSQLRPQDDSIRAQACSNACRSSDVPHGLARRPRSSLSLSLVFMDSLDDPGPLSLSLLYMDRSTTQVLSLSLLYFRA